MEPTLECLPFVAGGEQVRGGKPMQVKNRYHRQKHYPDKIPPAQPHEMIMAQSPSKETHKLRRGRPGLTCKASWYPRSELNRNPRFRKPLLYPFELREQPWRRYRQCGARAIAFAGSLPTRGEFSGMNAIRTGHNMAFGREIVLHHNSHARFHIDPIYRRGYFPH